MSDNMRKKTRKERKKVYRTAQAPDPPFPCPKGFPGHKHAGKTPLPEKTSETFDVAHAHTEL